MAKKKDEATAVAAPSVKEESSMSKLDKFIEEQYEGIKTYNKDDSSVKHWYDWGNYALNYICSKNLFWGAPAGRVVSVKGLSGCGKSLLIASEGKDPSVDMIIVIEAEGGGFTPELFSFAGGDLSKLRRIRASTFGNYKIKKVDGSIEEVNDSDYPAKKKEDETYVFFEGATRQVRKLVNSIEYGGIKANIIIVLDSLANLQSVREKTGTVDMGKRAQDINIFFRTFDNSFERTNIQFVFTNKLYSRFGDKYHPWVENGGESVIYNPSLSLLLAETSETDDMSDAEIKEEKERRRTALGSSVKTVRATVDKSRFGTEYRNIPILIDFATGGIFKYSGLFTLCNDFGLIKRTGSVYTLDGVIEGSFYKKDFIKLVIAGGKELLDNMQKKLEEAEERIKKEKNRLQETADIGDNVEIVVETIDAVDELEADDYDQTELVNAMARDLGA